MTQAPQVFEASRSLAATMDSTRFTALGRRISRNAMFGLGQGVVVAACSFLAYREVIAHAGIEQFGIWSLLLAGATLVRVGDVSGGSALARLVARTSRAQAQRDVVHTVMLTCIALNVAIGVVVWLAAPLLLPSFVGPANMAVANTLLPYAVTSSVLGGIGLAIASGIDGAQRADWRSVVVMTGSIIFLAACVLLVPAYGVVGFGVASVMQQVTLVLLGWIVLRRHVAGLGWLPVRWRRAVFAETTGYAMKLNGTGVANALADPIAKFAFNHVGGPALVALYDLASRLAVLARSLVISGASPLVPAFAASSGPSAPSFRIMLEKANTISALAAVAVALVALAGAPLVSLVVLGHLSPELIFMNAALTAGWAINVLAIPIYLAAQAFGILRWNFASHVLASACVLVAAMFFAPPFGIAALVGGLVAGLLLGMFVIVCGNAQALGVKDVMAKSSGKFIAAGLVIVSLCLAAGTVALLLEPAA